MEKLVCQCAESKIQDEYLQLSVIAQSIFILSARKGYCIVSIMIFFHHIKRNVSDILDIENAAMKTVCKKRHLGHMFWVPLLGMDST